MTKLACIETHQNKLFFVTANTQKIQDFTRVITLDYLLVCFIIMLENSWSNKLTFQPKIATIINIPNPTLIYQSSANQLIAHSQTETSALPIRKDILAIGCLPTSQILLLSRYQLICFDLTNNNELFNLQFENAKTLYVEDKYIYVVCGSDLFCYDSQGEEQYVNHCSSVIEALTSVEFKGSRQIVLALNDLNLVRYRGVNISFDYGKVSGVPSSICWIGDGVLVGTQEGPVSFHQGKKSKWKAKSSHPVFKVLPYLCEGGALAVIGRKDGVIELKDWKGKGETIHKIKLQEQLVGLFIHDFRKQDNLQLICVCRQATVRGLNVYEQAKKTANVKVADEIKLQQENIQALQNQKLNLQFELTQLRQQIALYQKDAVPEQNNEILRADFSYKTYLHHEPQGLTIWIQCFNGYVSGLTFEEAVMPIFFQKTNEVKYVFKAQNMVFGQISCYALVHSNFTSKVYETRGFKITLPKFWKFGSTEQTKEKIQGGVRFNCVQRNARYIKWLNQCFFMKWTEEEKVKLQQSMNLKMKFFNNYDKIGLEISFLTKQGKVQILCDCIKTLGDVFQDLIEYVGIKELDSQLWFPKQKMKLQNTLQIIERLSQAKVSISSEMAQAIQNIKFMLVKGESARCVGSMRELRRTYADIMGYNRNLLTQIQKKNQNTKQLSESLKVLGNLINQTANVRYGKAKELMIASCRQAIKKKEFPKIIAIMERGAGGL